MCVCACVCAEQIYKESHCFHCFTLLSPDITASKLTISRAVYVGEAALAHFLTPPASQPFLREQMSAASALDAGSGNQSYLLCESQLTAAAKP